MFRRILINEAIKALHKKRTYISFILLFFLVPLIILAIGNGADYLERQIYGQLKDSFLVFGSLTNGYLASYLIIAILAGQMPFLATIVAAEIVSGEYAKGTFRMYLSRPVSRLKILFSKLVVVLLYTIIMMFFFVFYTLGISCIFLGIGDLAVFHKGLLFLSDGDILWRFFLAYLISCGVMLAISSLCFMISTFSRNSVTPIIITISAVFIGSAISFIPLEIFELVNPYLFTGYIDLFLAAFHDPVPWGLIKNATVICGLWSSVFIMISFYNFSNKEILS
jgi:ABC-2 type transport system permease protein|tara:strand:- start:2263 stop:3102 length:840 start_codon:yes stop_codon:yes gene_type:complete